MRLSSDDCCGGDFGVDAIYFGPPNDGEFSVTLFQGKYKQGLEGISQFPENGIVKMFDAIRTIFNPSAQFPANDRMRKRIEEVRSIIGEGFYPQIRVVLCNNGPRWNYAAQQRIDAAGFGAPWSSPWSAASSFIPWSSCSSWASSSSPSSFS